MGNVLNLIGGRTAPQRCHPEHIYQGRIQDYQFELWSILIYRAISEYICRQLIYEKGIANDQFRVWSILLLTTMSHYISNKPIYGKAIEDVQFPRRSIQIFKSVTDYIHKPIYGKGIAHDQFQLWIILLWRAISGYIYRKTIYKKGISIDQFVNLPKDVQCIILSKLPLKEVVRTSVLSRKWKCLWTVCPRLSFDGTTMFGNSMNGRQRERYTQQFISTVNAVLQQCRGRVVEELVIKFEFDTLLVDHLNNWVRFSVSSHTKFLAFDLKPRGLEALDDPRYIFPFQLFDSRGISHLQYVRLRFVSVEVPTQFSDFPKLRKLDLHKVKVTAKYLQGMLSNCCALEWLSIVHCNMDGELKVHSPLPCLLYLNVAFCELTKIEFSVLKLRTFVYEGSAVPINLSEVSELKNANIFFPGATIEDAIPALASVLTNVQNLTFNIYVHTLEFSSLFGFYYMKGASIRRFRHTYNYLKDVCITGFKASSGQIEFLVHIVENTPALEVLTIDPSDRLMKGDPLIIIEREANFMDTAYRIVRRYIEENISPKCTLNLLF